MFVPRGIHYVTVVKDNTSACFQFFVFRNPFVIKEIKGKALSMLVIYIPNSSSSFRTSKNSEADRIRPYMFCIKLHMHDRQATHSSHTFGVTLTIRSQINHLILMIPFCL